MVIQPVMFFEMISQNHIFILTHWLRDGEGFRIGGRHPGIPVLSREHASNIDRMLLVGVHPTVVEDCWRNANIEATTGWWLNPAMKNITFVNTKKCSKPFAKQWLRLITLGFCMDPLFDGAKL